MWPSSHANQPVFSVVHCLIQGLRGDSRPMCMHANVYLRSSCLSSCVHGMLWDGGGARTLSAVACLIRVASSPSCACRWVYGAAV